MNKKPTTILASLILTLTLFSFSQTQAAKPSDFGLKEGDVISAIGSGDPDVYIVNDFGYKRLFVNPEIFNLYGHLGWDKIKKVSPDVRDAFLTSGLFRNCESGDERVYGLDVVSEDIANLRWVNTTGSQAVADDPDFFKKVFCVNNKETKLYGAGTEYSSVRQIPDYTRKGVIAKASTPTPVPTQPESLSIGYITPNRILNNIGAVDVSVIGTGFKQGASVDIGAISKPLTTFVNDRNISAKIPGSLTPGQYDLIVINPNGENITLKNALTIQVPPLPVKDAITVSQIFDLVSPSIVKIVNKCLGYSGSGFVFDNTGYILTNHHVARGCGTAEIKLKDNSILVGQVVGTNGVDDIAVIKVSQNLPALILGDSSESVLLFGSRIFVAGHPQGLTNLDVREGKISSSGQPCTDSRLVNDIGPCSGSWNYLTTTAATEKGGSGGPWINEKGEVVGFLRGGYATLDFAIPINFVKTLIPSLKAGTSVPAPSATPTPSSTPAPTPTPTPTPEPITPGTISVTKSPDSPQSRAFYWGQTDAEFLRIRIRSTNEAFHVERLNFYNVDNTAADVTNNIDKVKLTYTNKAGTTLTSTGSFNTDTRPSVSFGFVGDERPYVPKDSSADIIVKANSKTKAQGATSEVNFAIDFSGGAANEFRAVGDGSGTLIEGDTTGSTIDDLSGNNMYVYRVFPKFEQLSLAASEPLGTKDVLKFKMTAHGLADSMLIFDNDTNLKFDVVASGQTNQDMTANLYDMNTGELLATALVSNAQNPSSGAVINFNNWKKVVEITGGSQKTFRVEINFVRFLDKSDYFQLILKDKPNQITWKSNDIVQNLVPGFINLLPMNGPIFVKQ